MGRYDTPEGIIDLASALRKRAAAGKNMLLSPGTALLIARLLEAQMPQQPPPPKLSAKFQIDAFDKGSAIYHLDKTGEIIEVVAWAKNSLVANAAFTALVEQYPGYPFQQKRKSWVENET